MSNPFTTILVVDDELGTRESVRAIFSGKYNVACASTGAEAQERLREQKIDLVLLDVFMEDINGLDLLAEIREMYPSTPVMIISASTAADVSQAALAGGAACFVRKPFDIHELRNLAERLLAAEASPRHKAILDRQAGRDFSVLNMVGKSNAFQATLELAQRAAFEDKPVLLVGERGTGKELVARQIHGWSPRREEPFVSLSCTRIEPAGSFGDIFGTHDAVQNRESLGAVGMAGRGAVYLDDIERLPGKVNAAILNAVREGNHVREGGSRPVPLSARLMASSTYPAGASKSVEKDFPGIVIHVPSLRERPDDIPLLAYNFLNELRPSLNATAQDFTAPAMEALRAYEWPGNIRELRNVIERILVLHSHSRNIDIDAVPAELMLPSAFKIGDGAKFEETVGAFEKKLILNALRRTNGRITAAANLLSTTARILKYRMDKLDIRLSVE